MLLNLNRPTVCEKLRRTHCYQAEIEAIKDTCSWQDAGGQEPASWPGCGQRLASLYLVHGRPLADTPRCKCVSEGPFYVHSGWRISYLDVQFLFGSCRGLVFCSQLRGPPVFTQNFYSTLKSLAHQSAPTTMPPAPAASPPCSPGSTRARRLSRDRDALSSWLNIRSIITISAEGLTRWNGDALFQEHCTMSAGPEQSALPHRAPLTLGTHDAFF